MSDAREKGKGLFGRLLKGSLVVLPAEAQSEVSVDDHSGKAPVAASETGGWLQRLKSGLGKTSSKLTTGIADLFSKRKLDAATLDDLEDLLTQADLGLPTTARITAAIGAGRFEKGISADDVRAVLAAEVERVLVPVARPLAIKASHKPHVIMMVGVNGTGKTTTIGKLAKRLDEHGLSVLVAAADTFRAAAEEQLEIWAKRAGADFVGAARGSDPAAVAYDAIEAARARGRDVVIVDTAGRLHTQSNLMEELAKVRRVIESRLPGAPHETLLVVDATTGQNGLQQARLFRETAGVTGVVLTKLDGSAKGGVAIPIAYELGLPVKLIGVGETLDDLRPFDPQDFARALVEG